LGRHHVTGEIFPRNVSPQLIIGSIDAVSIKRRLPAGGAEEGVGSEDLLLRDACIVIEGSFVGLKGELASE
jgi:hypothetical protein